MTYDPNRPPAPLPPPSPRMEAFSPVAPEPFDPSILEQPVVPVRAAGSSARALNLALGVAVLVAASGTSFALGRASAPAPVTPAASVQGANVGAGTANGGGGNLPGPSLNPNGAGPVGGDDNGAGFSVGRGGSSVQGTVQSVAADGITIALTGGRTITIGLNGSTTYHAQAAATAADVVAGKTVIVRLSGNFRSSDGTSSGGGVRLGTATDVTVLP